MGGDTHSGGLWGREDPRGRSKYTLARVRACVPGDTRIETACGNVDKELGGLVDHGLRLGWS